MLVVAMPDLPYRVLGWILIGGGLALAFWAIRGDRARGRARCPRCWYDLTAAQSLLCPECGHLASTEAALHRTRRPLRLAIAGAIATLAGISGMVAAEVRERGWLPLAPGFVLAALPGALEAVCDGRPLPDSVAHELTRRGRYFSLRDVDLAILSSRFTSARTPAAEPATLRVVYDVRDIAPVAWVSHWCRFGDCDDDPTATDDLTVELVTIISSIIDAWDWMDSGGDLGSIVGLQGRLFVAAPHKTHQKVRALLAELRGQSPAHWPDGTPGAARLAAFNVADLLDEADRVSPETCRSEFLNDLWHRVTSQIDPPSWVDNGGDIGHIRPYRDSLVIHTTPDRHAQVRLLLDSFRAAGPRSWIVPPVELTAPAPSTAPPPSPAPPRSS